MNYLMSIQLTEQQVTIWGQDNVQPYIDALENFSIDLDEALPEFPAGARSLLLSDDSRVIAIDLDGNQSESDFPAEVMLAWVAMLPVLLTSQAQRQIPAES